MDRFRHYPSSWDDRVYDGADIADAVIEWIRTDANAKSNRLFYFLHFFDPHYPYVPPQPEQIDGGLDYEIADQLRERAPQTDYLDVLTSAPVDFDEEKIGILKENYEVSLKYTAFQVQRVIQQLKRADLFEDSFVVITGDHGEEFFERKFWGHSTLYDANIRPGMILKPPADSEITVHDNVDLIDIFPTIAELIESEVPETCHGVPIQHQRSGPRITERHGAKYYNVAVEKDGTKGIFTYDYEFPGGPTYDQVAAGPRHAEFCRLSEASSNIAREQEDAISEPLRTELRALAESFIERTEQGTYQVSESAPQDVEDRLEQLGYK